MSVNGPVFDVVPSLPRGPHDLSREDVRASQQARLNAAIAALVAEQGYPGVTIGAIAGRAGVSRATFYEHYGSKEACYLAAYTRFGEVLLSRLAQPVPPGATWEELVDVMLARYLGTLDGDPAAARAFVLEIDGAGPAARAEGRKVYARMAAFARAQHEAFQRADPSLAVLPPEAYLALVHGMRGLVRDVLDTDPARRLTGLAPSLRLWIAAIIRGAAAAEPGGPLVGFQAC